MGIHITLFGFSNRKQLQRIEAKLMALSAENEALRAQLEAAVAAITAKIDALVNSGADAAEFRAALQPLADALTALGQ